MEQLIPLIIMLIVGSLFKNKKGKDAPEKEQGKPFTAQEGRPIGPVKKLKEMSQEMYRELQQEMQRETETPERRPAPQVVIPTKPIEQQRPATFTSPVNRIENEQRRSSRSERKTSERSAIRAEASRARTRKSIDLLPKSEEDIMKGVIFSEIFGPPKSKR